MDSIERSNAIDVIIVCDAIQLKKMQRKKSSFVHDLTTKTALPVNLKM
jgi:hypothetical protein